MNKHRFHLRRFLALAALCAGFCPVRSSADPITSDVSPAFQVARTAVGPDLQNKVVSVYGLGTPTAINKWYFIFYDPSVASHGRAVLVNDGKIVRTYDAQGGTTYSSRLTFDPSRITGEQPALSAAETYAANHNLTYNGVRALLKEVSVNKPFRWRIELMNSGTSRGYVLVNAVDDTVATYVPPHSRTSGSGSGSVSQDAQNFGHDVQDTFLGIGGDLQQFFTGERTVDQ